MPLDNIPAAAWTLFGSISTLIVTGVFGLIRDNKLHKQSLKKELFLRKLQTYESNITFVMEELHHLNTICQALRELGKNYGEAEYARFSKKMAESFSKYQTLEDSVINSLHIILLYSDISFYEDVRSFANQLKKDLDELNNFKEIQSTKGAQEAWAQTYLVIDRIEAKIGALDLYFRKLFKSMQEDIRSSM